MFYCTSNAFVLFGLTPKRPPAAMNAGYVFVTVWVCFAKSVVSFRLRKTPTTRFWRDTPQVDECCTQSGWDLRFTRCTMCPAAVAFVDVDNTKNAPTSLKVSTTPHLGNVPLRRSVQPD